MNQKPYVTSENLKEKTKIWLEKISAFNQHKIQISKTNSALLVIDMQKFFLDPNSSSFTCGGIAIIPNIKKLINVFRKIRLPVIYTKHVHHPGLLDAGIMSWWWDDMCVEGTPESEIHQELEPTLQEKVILKHRYSAFFNTDLETVLRCLKVEDLVITGVMTNMCCESTVRDAYFRDYKTFFLADATGTINEEMHLASLLNLAYGFAYITTTEDIINQLTK